ncbi:hypothetical protein [Alkalicoccus daliensis]|uniref:Peptidylprolyl isomerase n=1 Tax=Alkalicoccus daliensis TaxID=745820 RepID=A0A1H0CXP2_9BACI|nr:hypothetical protein [Alkalicoccus daliensis]SDN62638.1 hypothetical protein SAMN04488053_102269 [Alkalicoccus daliensis]
MKIIFRWSILVIFILCGCNSSKLSFSEIDNVPDHMQENVDSNLKLQQITDGEKGYYIVFHSSGEVETDLDTQGGTLTIKLNETNLQDAAVQQNVYYLTTDAETDTIDVHVNGESTAFEEIVIQ